MTTMELNAEMQRLVNIVSEDEAVMKRAVKYLKNLVAKMKEKEEDDSLMTKEEYFAMIDEAHQQVLDGKTVRMLPGETLDQLLERTGHGIRH